MQIKNIERGKAPENSGTISSKSLAIFRRNNHHSSLRPSRRSLTKILFEEQILDPLQHGRRAQTKTLKITIIEPCSISFFILFILILGEEMFVWIEMEV